MSRWRARLTAALAVLLFGACGGDIEEARHVTTSTRTPVPRVAVIPPDVGPRPDHVGVPTGVAMTQTRAGGTLAPGHYDRIRFTSRITAPCGTVVTRSVLPELVAACNEQGARRVFVIASDIGSDDPSADHPDVAVHGAPGHYVLWGVNVRGGADAVRLGNDIVVVDSILRVWRVDPKDHNDAVQAYQAPSGTTTIAYSDLDTLPVNAPSCGCGNAAVMVGDNSAGRMILDHSIVSGGGYTLRLYEMTYDVTNNVVRKGRWIYGPYAGDRTKITSWSGNTFDDGTPFGRP